MDLAVGDEERVEIREMQDRATTIDALSHGVEHALRSTLARGLQDPEEIVDAFSKLGFRLLTSRPVRLRCSCSRERMVQNLHRVWKQQGDELFAPGEDVLEAVCDYCKSRYSVAREELERSGPASN